MGRLQGDHAVPCGDVFFSIGDFVDVGVTFDIVYARMGNGQRKLRVHLGMGHLLRILPSTEVEKVRVLALLLTLSCRSQS